MKGGREKERERVKKKLKKGRTPMFTSEGFRIRARAGLRERWGTMGGERVQKYFFYAGNSTIKLLKKII